MPPFGYIDVRIMWIYEKTSFNDKFYGIKYYLYTYI